MNETTKIEHQKDTIWDMGYGIWVMGSTSFPRDDNNLFQQRKLVDAQRYHGHFSFATIVIKSNKFKVEIVSYIS